MADHPPGFRSRLVLMVACAAGFGSVARTAEPASVADCLSAVVLFLATFALIRMIVDDVDRLVMRGREDEG